MVNILDSSALLSSLPNLLPTDRRRLENQQDGLAALMHTIMSALAFRLIAIDDSSPGRTINGNVLPEDWNRNGPAVYVFRYRHEQSSLEFVIKTSKLAGRTIINAIATESDKTATLDISTEDYVSRSFFPFTIEEPQTAPLVHGFIGSHRVSDFVSLYKLKILQKLVPGLRKEGYTEETVDSSSTIYTETHARPDPPVSSQSQNQSPYIPFRNPLEVGRQDLDPLPLQNQPSPFAPPSLFPSRSGDGMIVGPNHPIFGNDNGRPDRPDIGRGPWGGDGYLPPLGAPPGARFDPVGPRQGNRPFGGRNSNGPRGFGLGGPDNDEFLPPGFSDMYS